MSLLTKLNKDLRIIEDRLNNCRTSTLKDGFGTMRHARKSVNWDYWSKKKIEVLSKIADIKKTPEDYWAEYSTLYKGDRFITEASFKSMVRDIQKNYDY